ncbi:enediyne biosynthesis protein [Amycolatopsis sp., V23-08]|uniref:Enediyne biosynthesis protein n=1 Tax=Amycolatopsis heterodermiae TaxID=3110235 RepID=A0ABU5RL87_9PSEU|nr:enediyne biosynthesis protein [Amycolatopsis sp., V23-08]MEA5366963.1 enediyne biosynthesis protein [Amycolatopsis sp., V23-08]
MVTPITTKVDTAPPKRTNKVITALRRFAISITIFNILGYTVLGFEQPWLYPFVALLTAYTTEIGLEILNARVTHRDVRFRGNGFRGLVEFLFPAHITALALNMLTYVNDHIWAMIFGVVVAVGAKWVLQAPVFGRMRHYMNPSNFGITIMLLVFPWVNMTPPYHFSEKVDTWIGWLIVAIILISGTVLNSLLTGRMFLIAGWLSFFVVQAVLRGVLFGTAIPGALAMGTGIAFVLYTNYMVTDPGTSPSKPFSQFAFGGGIAMMYGFFTAAHIAYGLFFATASVCLIRGMFLWGLHFSNKARIKFEAEQAEKAELAEKPAPPVIAAAGEEKPLAA